MTLHAAAELKKASIALPVARPREMLGEVMMTTNWIRMRQRLVGYRPTG